jgi:hypothetical protein
VTGASVPSAGHASLTARPASILRRSWGAPLPDPIDSRGRGVSSLRVPATDALDVPVSNDTAQFCSHDPVSEPINSSYFGP